MSTKKPKNPHLEKISKTYYIRAGGDSLGDATKFIKTAKVFFSGKYLCPEEKSLCRIQPQSP